MLSVIVSTIEVFFHTAFGGAFHILTRARTCRRLVGFAYFCVYAGRTSPRASHRAGPPRVSSRQAGTVGQEASETAHLVSTKEPRSAESTRNLSPARRDDSGYPTYICVTFEQCCSRHWSPRWTSGSPRMLLLMVLVREFESRRGEISNLFAKVKKGSTAESA